MIPQEMFGFICFTVSFLFRILVSLMWNFSFIILLEKSYSIQEARHTQKIAEIPQNGREGEVGMGACFLRIFFLERELFKKWIIYVMLDSSNKRRCVLGFKVIFNNCCIFMSGQFRFGFELQHLWKKQKCIKPFFWLLIA